MRSGHRSFLIVSCACVLVLSSSRDASAWQLGPAKSGGYERSMAEAGVLVDKGKHREALVRFAEAFEAMPADVKVSDVGEFVVYSGTQAALRQFQADGDPAVLLQGKALAASFLVLVGRAQPGASVAAVERAQAALTELEALSRPVSEPEPAAGFEPPVCDPVEPGPDPVPTPAPTCPAPAKPDRLAPALLFTGSLALAGGVALIVVGARQVPWYEARMAEFGWEPGSTGYDYEAKLDEARAMRNIDVGVGAALAAVGVGAVVYGAVRSAHHRSTDRDRASLGPLMTRHGGGLVLMRRF